jgi:hypothetical protein
VSVLFTSWLPPHSREYGSDLGNPHADGEVRLPMGDAMGSHVGRQILSASPRGPMCVHRWAGMPIPVVESAWIKGHGAGVGGSTFRPETEFESRSGEAAGNGNRGGSDCVSFGTDYDSRENNRYGATSQPLIQECGTSRHGTTIA